MKKTPLAMAFGIGMLALAPAALATPVHGSLYVGPAHHGETDAQEAHRLAPSAKISRKYAIAVAHRAARGHVKSAELDDENGYLVWSVTVGNHEVLVDAGNGKVLGFDTAD